MIRRRISVVLGSMLAAAAACHPQWAAAQAGGQTTPPSTSVVRIVMPFPAGTAIDASLRGLAEALQKTTKRHYIVENKPGASGVIGTAEVARAKPDGTTLLFMTGGHTTNAAIFKKLPYDSIKDFTPITQVAVWDGFVMLVSAASPYKTFQEFIAAAKTNPGKISYGSYGVANTSHVIAAMMAHAAGVELLHVPYKESPVPDVIGGRVDAMFLGYSLARPLLTEGKMRALAVAGDVRQRGLPEVPSFGELGLKGVDVPTWSGLMGPAGMSPALLHQVHQDVAEAVRHPDFVALMSKLDMRPVASSPKEFSAYVASEIARFKTQLAPLGIALD
jgi:tripartite-type tricarboxylate transporter receptor subunit TctC